MKNKINSKHILAFVLGVFVIAYNWIWFNKTFTLSEGWSEFYVELMNRGKVPYRDFYYFLPPLSLFEDWLIWKFSFGYFIVYRLWRLIQRVFIVEFVYYMISKRVHPVMAFISGILSTVLLSANVYDLCGDYNQTQQFLVILMGYVLLKYVDSVKDNSSKKYLWTTFVGIIGGLMFLQKQTVVLASVLVLALLLLIFILTKYEKNGIKTFLSVIIGSIISLAPTFVYLLYNKALAIFIYQVYQDTSSKGGVAEIVFGKLGKVIADNSLLLIIGIGFILASQIISKYKKRNLAYGIIIASCVFLGVFISNLLADLVDTIANIDLKEKHGLIISLYKDGLLFGHMPKIVTVLFLSILIWIMYHIIDCAIKKQEYDFSALVLAFTAIISGYSSIMANGETFVSTITAFIVVPVAIYLLFRNTEDYSVIKISSRIMSVIVALIFIVCLSQKLVCPYSWWGDTEAAYWEKTETVDIKSLKGYKFSKLEKMKYEELNNLISYYSDEDSVIWGFPYVKVYNLFQENYNMSGFVPVEFYDVCADDYAKQEAKLLSKNKPDIVIWTDIPKCIELHESVYRNGDPLGQRDIQKWFSNVKDTEYTLIGQVDDVFIYKLNDEMKTDYTYITRRTRKNETAEYNFENISDENKLSGDGTKDTPYLIESLEDLKVLRDSVNSGKSFEGCYFRQTNDIVMDSSDNWIPIGDSEENIFSGIYDGCGHTITGLYILSESNEDMALFGWINGTIANLSLKDAWVGGQYVAIIACHGQGKVINCYSSGILYGYEGGGIAYDINGPIYNCVSVVNIEQGDASGISGCYTNDVQNCYSNLADGIDIDSGDTIDSVAIENLNKFVYDYNKNSGDIELVKWFFDADGIHMVENDEN